MLERVAHELRSGRGPQLLHDVREVGLDCAHGEIRLAADSSAPATNRAPSVVLSVADGGGSPFRCCSQRAMETAEINATKTGVTTPQTSQRPILSPRSSFRFGHHQMVARRTALTGPPVRLPR